LNIARQRQRKKGATKDKEKKRKEKEDAGSDRASHLDEGRRQAKNLPNLVPGQARAALQRGYGYATKDVIDKASTQQLKKEQTNHHSEECKRTLIHSLKEET
jgi:hypothetical protein